MADEQRTLTANFTANSSGFAKGTTEAIQRLRDLNTELAQVKQSVRNTNAEIRSYEKQLDALKKATNNGENATEEQRQEMHKLEDAIAQCTAELGSYQAEQQRLQSSIRATNKQIDEQGQTADKTSEKFKKFGAALAAAGTAVAAGITFAVTKASEMQTAVNNLTIATGASADEAARYKEAIEAVYGGGFGDDLKDVSDSIAQIKRNLTDLNDTELTDVTESALALRGAFGYDVSESSRAARALMQNFDVSAKDAYSYIYSGAQGGLDYAGDFLDSISEYSVQFAKMGLSAQEMFAIFSEGAENGAWNIDKVGDAVKEMAIRVIDGSKSTQEGFALINMNADEMAQKFAQGGEAARQAFDDTLEAIKALEDPVKQDAAGVALLGTMWEDLGKDVVFSFASIEESSFAASEALEKVLNSKYNNTERQAASLKREIELIITDIGTELLPMANEIISDVKDELPEITDEIKETAAVVGNVIGKLWEMRDILGAIAVGGIGVKGTGDIIKSAKEIVDAVTKLKNIFPAVSAAAGPVGIALGAAAVAGFAFKKSVDAIGDAVDEQNEKIADLAQEYDELSQAAENYRETAEGVEDIADEYKRIKNSVTDTKEASQLLYDLQQDMIEQYGSQAAGIDLVNGSYETQLGYLQDLIDKNEEFAKSRANQTVVTARNRQQEQWSFTVGKESMTEGERKTLQAYFTDYGINSNYGSITGDFDNMYYTFKAGTSFEDRYNTLNKIVTNMEGRYRSNISPELYESLLNAREQMYAEWQGYLAAEESYKQFTTTQFNTYTNGSAYADEEQKRYQARYAAQGSATSGAANLTEAERKEMYASEKQLADDLFSVRELSEEQYYERLRELRDEYLSENTHEWYTATAELIKISDSLGGAVEKTADRISASMNSVKQTYQELMSAIDAELERRNRDKQDAELQAKINSVTAQLAYDNIDEYSRRSLERELAELKAEKEDILFERDITDRKAQVKAAYDAIEQNLGQVPVGFDPNAWQDMVNMAFTQIAEGYTPGASTKDQQEATKVYNIVINANGKDPKDVIEAVKKAIATGEI